jgi:hypothetical protein
VKKIGLSALKKFLITEPNKINKYDFLKCLQFLLAAPTVIPRSGSQKS